MGELYGRYPLKLLLLMHMYSCEELRQLIEQASASTKGVGYVAKRYLQAAEELLEFSKVR